MAKIIRNNTSGSIQLSPNFYLSEFTESATATRAGIDNTPNPLAVVNLFRLAKLLEDIRKMLGNKVISINSGFRGEEVNRLTGGSLMSEHMTGAAADFTCRGFGTPLQVCQAIVKSGIKFGQLIMEGTWVHISLPDGVNDGDVRTAHFAPGQKTTYTKGL